MNINQNGNSIVIRNQRSPDYFGNRICCSSGDQVSSDFKRPKISAIQKDQNNLRVPNNGEILHVYVLKCKPYQM